jgi:hypothetical protein
MTMPFNNDDWLKIQLKVAEEVKTLEEVLVSKTTQELAKDLTLPKEQWASKRLARRKAVEGIYRVEIARSARKIRQIAKEGLTETIRLSSKDVVSTIDKREIVSRVAGMSLEVGVSQINRKVGNAMQSLFTAAVSDYRATISQVQMDSRGLFETLTKAVETKSDNGFVLYEGAMQRKVSFKSYMEMSIRTEMQNNALYNLEQSAKAAGVEAFIASAHEDSADDHADYQGHYYLGDGVPWKEEYSKYNFHPKYHYLSEVKALGFLTRPNCRHYVMPVMLEQIESGKDLHKQIGVPNEKYKPKEYEALKEQRYNERNIRKYKQRTINEEVLLEKAPLEERGVIKARIHDSKQRVKAWQERQRLLAKDSNIKRQYIREKPGIVVQNAKVVRV